MKKRILAWILTLSMMFGLMASLPLTAGAAGATLTNNPDSGWDGTTATKPSGSGTKESPFLVTSAANLKWMSDNSGSGGASAINCIGPSGKQTVTADNPEVEVYFKQINDIDLNGHDLCAIGTYSAVGSTITKAQYFGGHYDGQGYTIKNGMFVSTHYAVNVNAGHNSNWSGGLFGNIWGATIENIVFDNIQAIGAANVGIVVGRAISATGSAADSNSGHNVISNIVVKDTCEVRQLSDNYTTVNSGFCYGGIVGQAFNTTISGCYSAAQIGPATTSMAFVGGIAGQIVYGSDVRGCVFAGNIDYTTSESTELHVGGIVGDWRGYTGSNDGTGGITGCINKGTASGDAGGTLYLGGILGCTWRLRVNATNQFSNNYMLSDNSAWSCGGTVDYTGAMAGGILTSTATDSLSTLAIKDCYTVAFDPSNGDGTYVAGSYIGGYTDGAATESVTVFDSSSVRYQSIANYVDGWENRYTLAGWDGFTATKPAGSGTKSDPYLIANGENLKWLANCPGNGGDSSYSSVALNGAGKQKITTLYTDDYVYCKQIADIDLGGKFMSPIGNYISLNLDGVTLTHTQYFHGEYDGQGYTIKNGAFAQTGNQSTNKNWPVGMFGVLWGATVKNLTFDNVEARGNSVVGIVAGHAYNKFGETVMPERQNVISNITVKDNCTVKLWTGAAGKGNYQAGGMGGLVGRAYNTLIEDCDVAATVDVDYGHTNVGGVVGYMGNATLVDGCTFSGTIDYNAALLAQTHIGGIAGTWEGIGNAYQGTSGIINSVNRGTFVDGVSGTAVLCLGGVLGISSDRRTAASGTNVYLFENNYNLSDKTTFGTAYATTRQGGVVGCFWNNNSYAWTAVNVANCHTVPYEINNIDTSNYNSGTVVGMIRQYSGSVTAVEINCSATSDVDTLTTTATAMLDRDSFTTVTTGWNGTTAIAPAGKGTVEEPYLIATAANLKWLSNSLGNSGDEEFSTIAPNHGGEQIVASLADVQPIYCRQTANIDLNGKSIKSIGSYIRWDTAGKITDNVMQFFSGEYDGQGYTIQNGTFYCQSSDNTNIRWAGGMFGCLYGGTVKNLTFDNVASTGNTIAGIVAGYAVALYSEAQDTAHKNVIENIIVTDTCTVTCRNASSTPGAYSAYGGLVGHAYNTEITNCSVAASIVAQNTVQFVGGIVGMMGHGTLVDHCIFKGKITYNNTISRQTAVGGIAADISSYNANAYTTTGITNCINDGAFEGAVVNSSATSFCMGGILGGTGGTGGGSLYAGTTYVMDNNYNLSGPGKWNYSGINSFVRVGGVVGGAWCNDNTEDVTTYTSFPITNCHTVTYPSVNGDGGASVYTAGTVTGAIRTRTYLDVAPETDCTQNSALRAEPALVGLKNSMFSEQVFFGAQYKAHDNGTYSVRFLSGVPSLNYTKLTYTVGISDGSRTAYRTLEQTKVYTSFTVGSGDTAETIYATDYGYKYLSIVSFSGLDASKAYTFSFTPTAVQTVNEEEVVLGGQTYTFSFDARKNAPLAACETEVVATTDLMINDNSISKYQIVYEAGDPVGYYTAYSLQKYIADATGITLPLVDNGTSSDYEIRVGYSEASNSAPAGSYSVKLAGNSLEILYGTDVMAATQVIEAMKTTYMNVVAYNVNLKTSGSDLIVSAGDMATAPVIAPQTVAAQHVDKDNASDLRVLYQNVWGLSTEAADMERLLDVRTAVYATYDPDVICLQEAATGSADTLVAWLLANGYSMYRGAKGVIAAGGSNTTSDSNASAYALPIFFKASKFTVVDSGYTQSAFAGDKGTSWVVLQTTSGDQFAVVNSHFSAGTNGKTAGVLQDYDGDGTYGTNVSLEPADWDDVNIRAEIQRQDEAKDMMACVSTIKSNHNVPIFTGGDYNSNAASARTTQKAVSGGHNGTVAAGAEVSAYAVYSALTEVYTAVSADRATPYSPSNGGPSVNETTGFYDLRGFAHASRASTIDYAWYDFTDASVTVTRYHVCHDSYSLTTSDHLPHFVDFSFGS